jgi:hypothetical protein
MVDPLDIHPDLIEFLKRNTRRGPIFTLACKHRPPQGETLIGEVLCFTPEGSPRSFEEIAQEAWELCQTDCDNYDRANRYWIYALDQNGQAKSTGGRIGLTFEPTMKELGDEGESQPPTNVGVLSQMMKQHEDMHRHVSEMTGLFLRHSRDEMRRKDERIEQLETREKDTIDAYAALAMQADERNAARLKETREHEMHERIFSKVELILPVVVNKAMGRGTDATGAILEDVAMLRRSIEMRPAAVPRILDCLSTEQQVAAGALLTEPPGPLTGELIRKFMGSLDDPQRGGIGGQLEKLANGVMTGDEIKLLSKIYNACADEERREKERRAKMLGGGSGQGGGGRLLEPSKNVRDVVEGGGSSSGDKQEGASAAP